MKNHDNHVGTGVLARTLGGVALALGAAQLAAPRRVARWLGLSTGSGYLRILRLLGVRESLSGLGLLFGRRPAGWLTARVAGDVLDAGLLRRAMAGRGRLGRAFGRARHRRSRAALAAVGGVAALDLMALVLAARRRRGANASQVVRPRLTASVTIDRSPDEVYAFWREVENLPRFVSFLEQVKAHDRLHSHWRVEPPRGPAMEWDATIVDDRPGQRIAWKIESGIPARTFDSGEVRFQPAPGGQGTEVHLNLWSSHLHTPRLLQKFVRKLPERFFVTQLRRLKQLLELGEITQSDASLSFGPHAARPTPLPGEREPVSPGMRESATLDESGGRS